MAFAETKDVKFDEDGFAMHAKCETRLVEVWAITGSEEYWLARDGEMSLASEGGGDKECEGVWCEECDVAVKMKEAK